MRSGTTRYVAYTLLMFYRGLHCPLCRAQLEELQRKLPEFEKCGVDVVAASADDQGRAERAKVD